MVSKSRDCVFKTSIVNKLSIVLYSVHWYTYMFILLPVLASYGGRSFAYAGPSNWNSLPAHLIVFLFHLLSATSKPLSFLSTRLAHTQRVWSSFYKNALYKFTVIITVIIIIKLSLRAAVVANQSITASVLGVSDRWICSIIRHSWRFSSTEALSAV